MMNIWKDMWNEALQLSLLSHLPDDCQETRNNSFSLINTVLHLPKDCSAAKGARNYVKNSYLVLELWPRLGPNI